MLILPLIICLSYLIESIFGFGGTIISLAALGFFYDFKELMPVIIYASVISSTIIILSDLKSVDKNILFKIFPYVLIGTIIGVLIFYYASADFLLRLFAIFILYHSLKSLFLKPVIFGKFMQKILLSLGGVLVGLFGTGGPLILMAIQNNFKDKSHFRASMAVVFLLFNLVRITQLYFFTDFPIQNMFDFWWLVFPLTVSILLGYKIHLSVSEKVFNKALSILLLFVAIIFLVK